MARGHCFYCLRQLSEPRAYLFMAPPRNMRTVDHIVPQARLVSVQGYPTDAKWRGMNKVPACFKCNNEKGGMWPLDWLRVMPSQGVEHFCKRLADLGCEQEDIDRAMMERAAA